MKVDIPKPLFGHRVLVTGGREFQDRFLVWDCLDEVKRKHGPFEVLIHGDARGVDTFAKDWAIATDVPLQLSDV